MKTYKIVTFGCQMNVHESEKIAGQLTELGYEQTENISDADVVVFNTCTIRETAVTRAHGNIGALKGLKKQKKDMVIAVCGCMTQKAGEAEKLKKKFPFLDIIFGTHNINEFGSYLIDYLKRRKKTLNVLEKEKAIDENVPQTRDSFPNAYVNIIYGCNNFCTYCIVPYVRGRERSREIEDIKNEVLGLLKDGYKEITLLGQNVNSYGNDLSDKNVNFANLLETLASLPYRFRLRFMTSHPKDFTKEIIEIIKKYDNISKYIHLPVQSGSDRILKEMNRKYSISDYLEEIRQIREVLPGCGITTDIMIGFPGETEDDFEQTLKLVKEVRFTNAFMFVYSRRSGTPAYDYENQIDEKTKKQRIMRLVELQNTISRETAKELIGTTVEVLCDDEKDGYMNGRTDEGRLVHFKGTSDMIGKFVNVKITKAPTSSLSGELVK